MTHAWRGEHPMLSEESRAWLSSDPVMRSHGYPGGVQNFSDGSAAGRCGALEPWLVAKGAADSRKRRSLAHAFAQTQNRLRGFK